MTLIDGFNLIYKFPDLEAMMYRGDLSGAMKGLVTVLQAYSKLSGEKITVCFDGKKAAGDNRLSEKKGGIKIYYTQDYSADAFIMELLKKSDNPRMITVVTSDKEIRFFARPFRAVLHTSEEYREKISASFEKAAPLKPEKEEDPVLSRDELSFWERMFSRKKDRGL